MSGRESLLLFQHLNALQTVGYTELFHQLAGNVSIEKAVDQVKQNTRQYAKRQMTWFKKDKSINWFHPQELEKMKELIKQEMI